MIFKCFYWCVYIYACPSLADLLIPDGVLFMVGAVEYKLFVGSLNKQATEKEVKEVSFMCINYLKFSCSFLRLVLFVQVIYSLF